MMVYLLILDHQQVRQEKWLLLFPLVMLPMGLQLDPLSNLAQVQTSIGRILCPVAGCPEASVTSRKHFHKFADIKNHLNAHCTGYLSGAVPVDFLRCHSYTQCSVCDKIIHTRYNGTCPRCRPMARAQEQMNEIRGRGPLGNISSDTNLHPIVPEALPSLSAIHENFVPIIKKHPC